MNPFEKSLRPARGMLLCLIGAPGVGKTSFAAQWPGVHFVIDPRDEGVIDLIHEDLISVPLDHIHRSTNYIEFKSGLVAALNAPDCKTIACESLVGVQDLCYDHCSKIDHGGDLSPKSFLNYQAGPIQADNKYFKELVDLLQVAQNRGKHGLLMGHTKVQPVKNPGGDDWLAASLACNERFATRLGATFSNIFHIVDLVATHGRDPTRAKSGSDCNRFVYTCANPQYVAKNRLGLASGFPFPMNAKDAFLQFCSVTKRNPKTGYRV